MFHVGRRGGARKRDGRDEQQRQRDLMAAAAWVEAERQRKREQQLREQRERQRQQEAQRYGACLNGSPDGRALPHTRDVGRRSRGRGC